MAPPEAPRCLIVSGRVWALGEPADEAARQVELCNRNLCDLAANFVDAGFTAVIDWVIPDRAQLRFFVETLAPRPVLFVVLAPGSQVCKERNTRPPIRSLQRQGSADRFRADVDLASFRTSVG